MAQYYTSHILSFSDLWKHLHYRGSDILPFPIITWRLHLDGKENAILAMQKTIELFEASVMSFVSYF